MTDSTSGSAAELAALERLRDTVSDQGATAEIHEDDSAMTPMLVVNFEGKGDQADLLRPLFHADGPVRVDSVYSHRVVVRGE